MIVQSSKDISSNSSINFDIITAVSDHSISSSQNQGVARDISARKQAEEEREKMISQLQEALDNIKTLKGLLPICANCKRIRDDKGYWNQIEAYVRDRTDAEFSHSICPEFAKILYSDISFTAD